jgi:hypothetical protein
MKDLSEEEQLQELISTFYRAAGMPGWKGNINNKVVDVFTRMLIEAEGCLKDVSWVFRPDPTLPPIKDLLYQVDYMVIEKMARINQESSCLEFILEKWDDKLNNAAK